MRALLALAVIVAFYVTALAISFLLLAILVVCSWLSLRDHRGGTAIFWLIILCGVPAVVILRGVLRVRPAKFVAPGPELDRHLAPHLWSVIDELAGAARTRAPSHVYLSPSANVSVLETGSAFGFASRRVLVVGAPVLDALTAGELRAVLAHELGHFAGGDTRLGGILAFTEGAFRSVLLSVHEQSERGWFGAGFDTARLIGTTLVKFYARIYLRLTRPSSQRQELAADELAATLVGRDVAISALEKVHIQSPLYDAYVECEVAPAAELHAVPVDLIEGFRVFRRCVETRGLVSRLAEETRERKTDPFDTHPALTHRIDVLRALPAGPAAREGDDAPAFLLVGEALAFGPWLAERIRVLLGIYQAMPLPWSEIARVVLPNAVRREGERLGFALFTLCPQSRTPTTLLSSIVRGFEVGDGPRIVHHAQPLLGHVDPRVRGDIATPIASQMLGVLFAAALLEHGATIEQHLGVKYVIYRLGDEDVAPSEVAARAMEDAAGREALRAWTDRLMARVYPDVPRGVHGSAA